MADRGFWLRQRDALGKRLEALGKSLAADTTFVLPPQLLEAQRRGELPTLPADDLYAGSKLYKDAVRQELAPLSFNPFGFENPQKVVAAVVAHMTGVFNQSGLLSQALLTDPKIVGPLGIRCGALVGLPVTFKPPTDKPDAKDLADLCTQHYHKWFPPGERVKAHRDLITMGFNRTQIIPLPARRQSGGGMFRAPELHSWMPGQYLWWVWDPARNFGRWFQSDKQGVTEPVPGDGQWRFATLTTSQPWAEGLILCLGLRYAMRLSIALNQTRFATALASGHNVYTGPVQLDGKSLGFIQAQLADPNNLNLLLPSGGPDNKWDAKWTGPNSAGAKDLFLGALEEHGMEIAEAVLGQNLTTEVKRGSMASARVQALVRQDVLELDAITEQTIDREQVLKPLAAMNFPGDPEDIAPVEEIISEPTTDKFLFAKALGDLSKFLTTCPPGVDKEAMLTLFGVPLLENYQDRPLADDQLDQTKPAPGVPRKRTK
jgi:hypothetical protein